LTSSFLGEYFELNLDLEEFRGVGRKLHNEEFRVVIVILEARGSLVG
jgi:hypothetical protein